MTAHPKLRHISRKFGLALCAASVAVAVAATAGAPAQASPQARLKAAAPGTDFTAAGVRMHAQPRLHAKVTGYGYKGDGLTQLGNTATNTDAYTCNGHQDYWWNKVKDRKTGVIGWIPQCFINLLPGPVSGVGPVPK